MTQVHVSRARYAHAQRELKTIADYLNIQNDILAQIRAQAATDKAGEQALIREELNALLAEVRFDIAHAQLQNAFANIYSSLGLDPFDSSINLGADVRTVSTGLQQLWRKRGDAVGTKSIGLLRAPRTPRIAAASGNLPPLPGNGASSISPPLPAPGSSSRSVGGSFLPPLTTQGIAPLLPPLSRPEPAAAPSPPSINAAE
jgi:hypothetical protein